jgi:glutamate synthase (NADPH/NADH) small chain
LSGKRAQPARLAPCERVGSFDEIEKTLPPHVAVREASRCLFCHEAPCNRACPSGVDVVGFIRKIKTKNFVGAIRLLREANPLAASCARICPQSSLCEEGCSRSEVGEPIAIGALQRFITDEELKKGIAPLPPAEPKAKKVAVVGGGPSGLTCAHELARKGYPVVVFEAMDRPGGLLRYGIPRYRLPLEVLDKEVTALGRHVEVRTNVRVGKDVSWDSVLAGFDAVYLACGLARPTTMNVPGEDLAGVHPSADFLARACTGAGPALTGKVVAVVGGGNTAMDCACTALRLGASRVLVVYRRSPAEMPAWKGEYGTAVEEGVEFHWLTLPEQVLGQMGVQGLRCVRMELGEPDASGRRRPVPIPGSQFELTCDVVIQALGQKLDPSLLSDLGLKAPAGTVGADPDSMQTSLSKVFAGGDSVNGGDTVIRAVAHGKRAAAGIDRFLSEALPEAGEVPRSV